MIWDVAFSRCQLMPIMRINKSQVERNQTDAVALFNAFDN